MLLYIFAFVLCSTFAYRMGIKNGKKLDYTISESDIIPIRLVKVSIYISLGISFYMLIYGFNKFGIPSGGSIAQNMAQAYSNGRNDTGTEKILAFQLYGNLSFFIYSTLILGMLYFKKLSRINKAFVICVYVNLFLYFVLFSGVQKNIADLFIILLTVKYIEFMRSNKKITFTKKTIAVIAVTLIICCFITILQGRAAMMNFNQALYSTNFYQLDFNHWMIKWVPKEMAIGIGLAIFYVSHGFYGLALCLRQPFVWTYGLASIPNLSVLITKVTGNSQVIDGLTYPERMHISTGYPAWSVWHTAFPWLASDFTFLGAILLLSVSAYIYAKTWKEILCEGKWQSVLLFTMLNIQWLYITANNQLFTSRATTMMFIITFFLWIIRNYKFSSKKNKFIS